MNNIKFEELKGLVPLRVLTQDHLIAFEMDNGNLIVMHHEQDCCEDVSVEDISGDIQKLCGNEILFAQESSYQGGDDYRSETWTFYKLGSIQGWIDIRWHGISNGCYSERVSIIKVTKKEMKDLNFYSSIEGEQAMKWLADSFEHQDD